MSISRDLYEHFCDIGYPYEGAIEGGGYAISEPILTPYQEYGCNETFLAVNNLNIASEYAPSPEPPSTDVRANSDGSYTVVGAHNDGDNNIYVVDEKGNRTGKVIGETLRPYDFINTNDGTGEFTSHANITIDLNKLTVSGKVNKTDETITNADREELLRWGKEFFLELVRRSSFKSKLKGPYGGLEILRDYSGNGEPLDIKVSLNLDKYTPVYAGKTLRGKPKITTLRAIGNEIFGANMRLMIPPILELKPRLFYDPVMKRVGDYNQLKNNGNGYNPDFPYFGEHTYSGSYIYFGFWKEFYE